jgi:hypothetical protein
MATVKIPMVERLSETVRTGLFTEARPPRIRERWSIEVGSTVVISSASQALTLLVGEGEIDVPIFVRTKRRATSDPLVAPGQSMDSGADPSDSSLPPGPLERISALTLWRDTSKIVAISVI